MSRAAAVLLFALGAGVAGCGSQSGPAAQAPVPVSAPAAPQAPEVSPTDVAVPATPSAPASPAPEPEPEQPLWTVGASPLPLRPDGFGQVLPTPEVLRDRRLSTVDLLPPPADGQFASTIEPVSETVRERMGESWSPECPVALADLRYLTVSFRGFDGLPHTGEMVVAASVADDVVTVFRQLFAERFPIEEMRVITTADLRAPATGDGNNTASYVCRAARGQTRWSQHAYGLAVDINPFHNPLVRRDLVIPELASAYADRDALWPGMHVAGGLAVQAFTDVGWTWGGTWRSSKDYMHFSQNGR